MMANSMGILRARVWTESRCSHYRLDYPEIDNENWQAWINIYKDGNGDMQFEKQPVRRMGGFGYVKPTKEYE